MSIEQPALGTAMLVCAIDNPTIPVGTMARATLASDNGVWLVCDGRWLDGRKYQSLFKLMGYQYTRPVNREGWLKTTVRRLFGLPGPWDFEPGDWFRIPNVTP